MSSDTIAAIATSYGIGSIAIVRISGKNALTIAKKISKKENLIPRYATLASLYDKNSEFIDRSIIIYFKAPKSFTGEDVVEFQSHGGVIVAKKILDTVIDYGARLAEPGEFSKRAFLNEKIDLTEAEAIAKLIEAKSEDALNILTKGLKGELKERIEDIRESLIKILAYTEVNIDYAEEDLPQDLMESIKNQLKMLKDRLFKMVDESQRRVGLLEGFKISIIGKPNTGKSSLLNRLLSFERAIVSDIAGTTRDTIEESIKIGTHLVKIVDTAGIREAKDEIEKIGISKSIKAIKESEIVIAMFDASKEFDSEDEKILELIKEFKNEKKFVILLNKVDLGIKIDLKKIKDLDPLQISVKNGISTLTDRLKDILDSYSKYDDLLLISKRQIDAVKLALNSITNSFEPLENKELEIFAFWINDAIKNIASITRPMESSELLDKMFLEFCLGK